MFGGNTTAKVAWLGQVVCAAIISLGVVGASVVKTDEAKPNRAQIGEARENDALPVEAVLQSTLFSGAAAVSFSLDGKWLAYAARDNTHTSDTGLSVVHTGIPGYSAAANVYVVDRKTGQTRNLTSGHENWLPTWSPDSRLLAFLSDRDGSGQARLWVWDVRTNQLHRVTEKNIRTVEIGWLPDSSGVVVKVEAQGSPAESLRSQDSPAGPSTVPNSTATLYEGGPVVKGSSDRKSADPWDLNRYLGDLVYIPIEPGGKRKTLASGHRISHFRLSPDGAEVAYTTPNRFEQPGSQQILFDLRTVTLKSGEQRVLASDIHLDLFGDDFRWSPDGLRIGYMTGGMEEKSSDCYAIEVSSRNLRNLTRFSPLQSPPRTSSPMWDRAGHVYFLRQGELWRATIAESPAIRVSAIPLAQIRQLIPGPENVLWSPDAGASTIVLAHDTVTEHEGFYKINLDTGSAERLAENGHCYTCAVSQPSIWVTPDGQELAFIREDARTSPDLWISDSKMNAPRRLTNLNPQLEHRVMGESRLVHWLGDDGQKLKGTLLLPSRYKEGIRYPLVVWIYGGAFGSTHLDAFGVNEPNPLNLQLLATRGYAVLFPDAPQTLGAPMFDLAKTVLPGISEIVNLGIADPDRVGVIGHSNGGYSVLGMIVQSKRFSAAIDISGFGDLFSSYGEMDAGGSAYGTAVEEHGGGLMGGTPWQFRDRYIENSPFFFLDRVSTPLLIVQGDADVFVSPFLADQTFVGLRRLGREVAYAKYHGEGHDPRSWSYPNQVDYCNRLIEWFERHLKNESGKDEKVSALNGVGARP